MTSRTEIETLMRDLYVARVLGSPDALCQMFCDEVRFELASANNGNRLAVNSNGKAELRSLLTLLMRTFRIVNQEILSLIIDSQKAAVHWRANVHSRVTGSSVPTEFIDLIEVQSSRISSYLEFYIPRLESAPGAVTAS